MVFARSFSNPLSYAELLGAVYLQENGVFSLDLVVKEILCRHWETVETPHTKL